MLSPNAMMEAARTAGLFPWQRGEDTLWHAPGESVGVPLESPFLLATVASWLRSDVVAVGGVDAHERYLRVCLQISSDVVGTGVLFCGDDISIGGSMVTLGHWSVDHARLALGFAQATERSA